MVGFLEEATRPVDLAEKRDFQGGGGREVLPGILPRKEGLPPSAVGHAAGRQKDDDGPQLPALQGLPHLERAASLQVLPPSRGSAHPVTQQARSGLLTQPGTTRKPTALKLL